MPATYVYKRQDGGTTYCFGSIEENSNFSIVCDDEDYDGIAADVDTEVYNTWYKVCNYLEKNYNSQIEEIESC